MDFLSSLSLDGLNMTTLCILFLLALLAGWVDAIGGGGGLISLPALFWAGVSPIEVLATNKLQSCFGSFTATWNYTRKGLINLREHYLAIVLTFIGAMSGAWSVQQIETQLLERMIPILLMLFAIYFMFAPRAIETERQRRISPLMFAATAGFGIGFYDGFFGPGTGTFFTIAFVTLLGYGLPRATGSTKLLNFTSNFAALLLFAITGNILWGVGILMGIGQMLGSFLGSNMAMKHGSRLIRPLLVTVSLLVSLRLLLDD